MALNGTIKVRVLGSGTSTGVPVIGCQCCVCTSTHPWNQRMRASILILNEENQQNLVIDTTPDFRMQMLLAKVRELEHVLYTHIHADHVHGFDDLRAFYFKKKRPIKCYMNLNDHNEFKQRFNYAFTDTGYFGTPPQIELLPVPMDRFEVIGLKIDPVRMPHGSVTTIGFKIGSFAYATDFKVFPEDTILKWRGQIKVMIASGLRYHSHPTHSTVDETISLFERLGVEKGVITHTSHDIDLSERPPNLPSWVSFAFDGMELTITP